MRAKIHACHGVSAPLRFGIPSHRQASYRQRRRRSRSLRGDGADQLDRRRVVRRSQSQGVRGSAREEDPVFHRSDSQPVSSDAAAEEQMTMTTSSELQTDRPRGHSLARA
jgi:hypothetical protein